jgi:hypothetical protein
MRTVFLQGSRPLSQRRSIVTIDGHATFLGAVVSSLVLPSLVDGTALGNAVIVALEEHDGVGWQVEDALDGFPAQILVYIWTERNRRHEPNLHVASSVILSPDAQDIFLGANAQDSSADLIAGFHKLVADHGKQQVFPVAVAYAFLESHDELPAFAIGLIFPDRTYTFSEEMVIGHAWQHGWAFEMYVDRPETLHRVHSTQRLDGFFVVRVLGCRRPVPDNPRIFQGKR